MSTTQRGDEWAVVSEREFHPVADRAAAEATLARLRREHPGTGFQAIRRTRTVTITEWKQVQV